MKTRYHLSAPTAMAWAVLFGILVLFWTCAAAAAPYRLEGEAEVYALAIDAGGNLYVGGTFTEIGGVAANNIAMWDGDTWSPLGPGLTDDDGYAAVNAIFIAPDGQVYVGGSFGLAGETTVENIARWDGTAWSTLHSGLRGEGFESVQSLAMDPSGNLYAAGSFEMAGDASADNVAMWNGSTWSSLGSGIDGFVNAVAFGNGNLYAGGSFSSAGGNQARGIAVWNGTTWSELGGGISGGDFPAIQGLDIDVDGNVFIGGSFTSAGSVSANNIAMWNGTAWSALGSGTSGGISAVDAAPDGSVYAGANFQTAGGVTVNGIARWNGASWSDLGGGVSGFSAWVLSIAGDEEGNVYIGGAFTQAGETEVNSLAWWNGSDWVDIGSPSGGGSDNNRPLALDDSYFTQEDMALTVPAPGVLANDSDPDGDPLTAVILSNPPSGTVVLNGDGSFTYTPEAGMTGDVSFSYEAQDGRGGEDAGFVTVSISSENDPPAAADDAYTTTEDNPLSVFGSGVLQNDTDPDDFGLNAFVVDGPEHGSVTMQSGGSFTFEPEANYSGEDSFTYRAVDAGGLSDTARVAVTITPVPDNPVAADDSTTTTEDEAVVVDILANDTDPDGDTLTVRVVGGPPNGSASEIVTPGGRPAILYSPDPDFHGEDGFQYIVEDSNGGAAVAVALVTVVPVNDPPVALDDAAETEEDTPIAVDVLANDVDVDGDVLTARILSQPSAGTAVLREGLIEYDPAPGFFGSVSLDYAAEDGQGAADTASVTISVREINDSPVAAADSAETNEDTVVEILVLGNDFDADGDSLSLRITADPLHGSAMVRNGAGAITYSPAADFFGPDSLGYEVADGKGGVSAAVVRLAVHSVNDAPLAEDDEATARAGVARQIDVLSNDSDIEGDALSLSVASHPGNGTALVSGDAFTYTPAPGFSGDDSFRYRVSDGNGGSAEANVFVTVLAAPEAGGRILSASGVAFGGIIAFNPDSPEPNMVNITENTFNRAVSFPEGQGRSKSTHPSYARNGLIAFSSSRTFSGYRIFVVESDGTGTRQVTTSEGLPSPNEQGDLYPVISPDGSQIAFISRRDTYAHPWASPWRPTGVYVVHVDGTGLKRLDTPFMNSGGGPAGSEVHSVVWSPDGSKLAFLGTKPVDGQWRQYIATINPDGSDEQLITSMANCGGGKVLDWSPDGNTLLYSMGGGVQGCYATFYVLYNLSSRTASVLSNEALGQEVSNLEGAARFSPDGSTILFSANYDKLGYIGVDGTNLRHQSVSIARDEPMWWMPGEPIYRPASLVLAPDTVRVWSGQSVPLTPTLYDETGEVISRSAGSWHGDSRTPVSITGEVSAIAGGANHISTVCASNAGVEDCVRVENIDFPIVTVEAADAEAAESGRNPGIFRFTRVGNPTIPLRLNYKLSGTARQFTDFTIDAVGGVVTLPARVWRSQETLSVMPAGDDADEENETVRLELDFGNAYEVGNPKVAEITITNDALGSAPGITAVVPGTGGNTGSVLAVVHGRNFASDAEVELRRGGETIRGTAVVVGPSGTSVQAVFDLRDRAEGSWDVLVASSGGLASLPAGFTVEEGESTDIWAEVVGPVDVPRLRLRSYTVAYGNRGNTDAPAAVAMVAVPPDAELSLSDEFPLPYSADGLPEVPRSTNSGGRTIFPLVLPSIPAGAVGTATFGMGLSAGGEFQVDLDVLALPDFTAGAAAGKSSSSAVCLIDPSDFAPLGEALSIAISRWGEDNFTQRFLGRACVGAATDLRTSLTDASSLPGSALDGWQVRTITLNVPGIGHTSTLLTSPDGSRHYLVDNYVTPVVVPMVETEHGWEIPSTCAGAVPLYDGLQHLKRGLHPITQNGSWEELEVSPSDLTCFGPSVTSRLDARVLASMDPNDKTGSPGAGARRYVSGRTPLSYTIRFENMATATAPAQEVLVVDSLDTERLDLSTFSFGTMTFGNRSVTPPPGARTFTTEVDLRPDQPLLVHIDAFLEEHSGVAVWKFTALDPATRDLPESPLLGFLPPNVNPPEGDGSLYYTVRAKEGLATGTAIDNKASIIFDLNEPIETPLWSNAIDNTGPASYVLPLAPNQDSTAFTVRWAGSDPEAGVQTYSIYVSSDGESFEPWLLYTADTSAVFRGDPLGRYFFYSLARDAAGNAEAGKQAADAFTGIQRVGVEENGLPTRFELLPNYPNPFNPETVIGFSVPTEGRVSVTVYNVIGQTVATLIDGRLAPGRYQVRWDARDVASGVYIYRMTAGDFSETRSMTLVR